MQEYSIFKDTMADMTYPEVEQAIRDGAVRCGRSASSSSTAPTCRWAPTSTSPWRLRRVRQILAGRGIQALIVPAFYWGVNHVTGIFPGSFHLRPEIMVEVMVDTFRSLKKDGFQKAFCLSGHGDALHNRTIDAGVVRGRADTGLDAYVVLSEELLTRLGLDPALPHLVATPNERLAGHSWTSTRRLGDLGRHGGVSGSRARDDRAHAPLHRLRARRPGGVAQGW